MIRIIGNTGIQIPALGMGCWAIGGEWTLEGNRMGWGKVEEPQAVATINAAYEAGIRLFDTAANYGVGLSERFLGKALTGKRQNCIISTKFGFILDEEKKNIEWPRESIDGNAARRVASECEASLKRLGTDYIDVYFFHQWEHDPAGVPELRFALDKLVEQGKIRTYGWSIDNSALASLLAVSSNCQAMQIALNVVQDNREMLDFCEYRDIAAFCRSPLAMGFLSGKYDENSTFRDYDVRSAEWWKDSFQKPVTKKLADLHDILTSDGRSPVQGALAWIWARSRTTIPIPGIRTEDQAKENAAAMDFGPLTPEQLDEAEEVMNRNKH